MAALINKLFIIVLLLLRAHTHTHTDTHTDSSNILQYQSSFIHYTHAGRCKNILIEID